MITMNFDLSSTCIGITFTQHKKKKLTFAKTLAIIPEKPTGKDYGYTTKKEKVIHYGGKKFKGFLKPGEFEISQAEAKRRSAKFKGDEHKELLKNIGDQCGLYLRKIKPDIIAIEKNASFNGILTTKLLAEIAGGLYFYAGANDIDLYDFPESTVRAYIRRTITDYSLTRNDGTTEIAVDTKWEIYCRLRAYFQKYYPGLIDFDNMTMDESDSLAVFYYLYHTKLLAA